jgi:hypothetical protein
MDLPVAHKAPSSIEAQNVTSYRALPGVTSEALISAIVLELLSSMSVSAQVFESV